MDPELQQILDRIGGENPPTNDELLDLRSDLAAAAREALAPEDGSAPNIEVGRALRESIDRIDAELTGRQEAAEAARAEAAELLEGIEPVDDDAGDGDTDDDDNGDGADDDGDGDGADDGGEGSPTDPARRGDGDANPAVGEGDEPAVDGDREPVLASADRAKLAQFLERGRARRRGTRRTVTRNEEPEPQRYSVDVALSGPAIGRGNQPPRTFRDMGRVFDDAAGRVQKGARQTLVTLKKQYPESRQLSKDIGHNTRAVEDVLSPQALVAAGGVCDPLPADFDHPVCGDRGRPIRDALAQFGATRGGVRYVPSATLGDVIESGAITEWDYDTDVDPSDQVKACPRLDCEDELTVYVDAVVRCLTVGNFAARFSPEWWESRLELLLIAHDKVAELKLFNSMVALSTAVTFASVTGNTINDAFLAIDRAMAAIQSRHRVQNTRFQFVAPLWLRSAFRASVVRQFGRGSDTDALSLADSEINRLFSDRQIDPVWSPDLDPFGAQAAGALLDWPGGTTQTLLYPQGTFFFLDGGSIDLGVEITDSQLNATNDRQAFAETFEQVALRGCEAYALTLPVDETCVCAA
jgi:hypothetical protein